MTDFTREEILELVDGRIKLYRHDEASCVGQGCLEAADVYGDVAEKYEHLRLVVERADAELFKEEK